jgi:hypothetical protein
MNTTLPLFLTLALAGVGMVWTAYQNRLLRRRVRQLEEDAKARK